jgi:hypothetical protein
VLVVGILATLTLLVVNSVVSSADDVDLDAGIAQRAYLDQLAPAIQRSNQQVADVAGLRNRGSALGSAIVGETLARITAESKGALDAVVALEPPEPLRTAHALLVASLTLRSRAAEALETGYATALSSSADPGEAVALFQSAGADLLAADRAYSAFEQAVVAAQVQLGTDVAIPEPIVELDSLAWDPLVLAAYVDSLRSASDPVETVDGAVVLFTTTPGVLRVQDGISVLPPGGELALAVIVANTGNTPIRQATVQATLTPSDGSSPTDRRDFVDLEPGERKTVKLGGLSMLPNVSSELRVEVLPIEGESELTNNVSTLTVAVLSVP